MAESLRGGLSLTMSGFGFWSHDIGGFENTSTLDVYKRWCAFGLLSTHSRLHGSSSYRIPWAYDEEAVEVVRFFTGLKASLMPYLFRNAIETSVTGVPVMRSMVLEFMEDPMCAYLDRQYMLGDSLLVAPVFNEEGIANYYLPEGDWTNYFTGEQKCGGRWYKEKIGYLDIPLMVKEGSILAIGAVEEDAVYDYGDHVTLKAYGMKENVPSTTVVYDNEKKLSLKTQIVKNANTVTIEVNSEKEYSVVLVNISNVICVTNADFIIKGKDTVIIPNGEGKIICSLA
jgi:alpha-D-xyloside xylohydrolase